MRNARRFSWLMLFMITGIVGAGGRIACAGDTPGKFDFYVLALSWSPDYCAAEQNNDATQCALGKKLGFVLHGLWPQYRKGFPQSCSSEAFPRALKEDFPALYPNDGLYRHEWEKHGTCSGLTPEAYLALTKRLKQAVAIPQAYRKPEKPIRANIEQIKAQFSAANSGLAAESLTVYCSGAGRFLKEVFICFDLKGKPTACSAELHHKAARSCQQPTLLIRNVK